MKLIPSSTACATRRFAAARTGGSPHTFGPVTRIAPNPMRFTMRSPSRTVPAAAAVPEPVMMSRCACSGPVPVGGGTVPDEECLRNHAVDHLVEVDRLGDAKIH